jgi:hypothetical protein
MRTLIIFMTMLTNSLAIFGQITITSATFPKVGDTLKYLYAINPSFQIDFESVGGPQFWDFDNLNVGEKQKEIYLNPQDGNNAASFPTANLLAITEEQERYFKVSNNKIDLLGYAGKNEILGVPLVVQYSKLPLFRKAPLAFVGSSNSNSEYRLGIGTDLLPDSLLGQLNFSFDSIRIRFISNEQGLQDGYGSLKMHGRVFETLRQKTERITKTEIEIKVLGFWISLANFSDLLGDFGNLLGQDTSYVYKFFNDKTKEILVEIEANAKNKISTIKYIDLTRITSTKNEELATISLYPNPSADWINIRFADGITDINNIQIHSMSGSLIYSKLNMESSNVEVDVKEWPTGQYYIVANNGKYNQYLSFSKQ